MYKGAKSVANKEVSATNILAGMIVARVTSYTGGDNCASCVLSSAIYIGQLQHYS